MEIKDLQNICAKMLELKKAIKEHEDEVKVLNGALTKLKSETIEYMENFDMKSFDHGAGKISISDKRAVKILDKYKFYEWLKARGTFEQDITVSAATAKRIYNEEWETAQLEGNVDFIKNGIDGLSEPNVFRTISFLKK
jgi:hypothetical protein